MVILKFAYTHNMVAFLSKPAESDGFEQMFWSTVVTKTINEEVQLHALVDGKKIIINESTVRRDLQLEDAEGVNFLPNSTIFEQLALMSPKTTAWNEFSSTMASAIICLSTNQKFNFSKYIFESMVRNLDNLSGKFFDVSKVPQPSGPTDIVADEAVHKELGDSLVRAATTASSLEAKQDIGNITKTRSKATPNKAGSQRTTLGGGPRCQETMGDTIVQTRFENVSKLSNDSMLARGNTLLSDEDSLKLKELKELYEEDLGEDASKQRRRINNIDFDDEITLVSVQDDDVAEMFDVGTLTGDEVFAEQEVAAKGVNLTVDEVTLAQALAALKSVKPKVKRDVIKEPSVPVSAVSASIKVSATTILTPRKGIVITELGTPTTIISSQQSQDKEIALKLQAKIDEEERIARAEEEKIDEANIA
ncbi:hypothetical protein Tco_1296801 [Tanacetum coccineum]